MLSKVCFKVVIAALIAGSVVMWSGPLQAQELRQPQPQDYVLLEYAAGSVGALIGGGVGAYLGSTVLCVGSGGWFSCLASAGVGFLIGDTLGATFGVVSAGSANRVQGNLPLALLGAVGGGALGILITNGIRPNNLGVPLALLVIPTGLGATLGYNVGATVEVSALNAKIDRLELISLTMYW